MLHKARASFIRKTRFSEEEFRIRLSKLARRQGGNLVQVLLYFSYDISFESFTSILRDETALQKDNGGFTLEDGPWKYSMVLNRKQAGLWFDLDDEKSFDDFIHKLRDSQGDALMIHVSPSLHIIRLRRCYQRSTNENEIKAG
jgi:hypothetical protein